jgi:tetraacyldisaccharide 4'-kinase
VRRRGTRKPSPSWPQSDLSMPDQSYLLSVIRGERRGPDASILRGALAGLAYLYTGGLKLYLLPYRLGFRKQYQLPCPVISIGNLTVGGTGKTPMTQLVCELLQERGLKVCVLSRGYRGAHEYGAGVVSTEKRVQMDAAAAGDEAHMLARMLPGVPVVVGKDRRKTGALAWEQFEPDVMVLDDAMQFYQLHRDLDIVLVDAIRPFDNGWTFPRGLLREPPSHIRRAGCVVITNADKAEGAALQALRARLAGWLPGKPLFQAHYAPQLLRALDRSGEQRTEWLAGRKVAGLCALGNPQGFVEQLEQAGAEVVDWTAFPDHHEPTMGELNGLIADACEKGAEAVVVTEKDAVKLPPLGRPLPFYALIVRQQVDDEAGFLACLLRVVTK